MSDVWENQNVHDRVKKKTEKSMKHASNIIGDQSKIQKNENLDCLVFVVFYGSCKVYCFHLSFPNLSLTWNIMTTEQHYYMLPAGCFIITL